MRFNGGKYMYYPLHLELTYSDFHSTYNDSCAHFNYQVQASYFSNTSGDLYGWDTNFNSSDESSTTSSNESSIISSDESMDSSLDSDSLENFNE